MAVQDQTDLPEQILIIFIPYVVLQTQHALHLCQIQ